jgi:hypothetical protein
MRGSFTLVLLAAIAAVSLYGCASQRDFIPNGAGVNLEPTNPDHIQVLDSVPRGMVIGTVLVDRSKAATTAEIIEQARQKAASVGADFIVWEDSLGTLPSPSASPGGASIPDPNSGTLGHSTALPEAPPEETAEKTPKARFTVGIFMPDGRH